MAVGWREVALKARDEPKRPRVGRAIEVEVDDLDGSPTGRHMEGVDHIGSVHRDQHVCRTEYVDEAVQRERDQAELERSKAEAQRRIAKRRR